MEGSASGLCLLVLIDCGQVNVGVGSFKLLHLAVKSILVKLGAKLTELLLSHVDILVVVKEGLGVAAELMETLPTGKLAIHIPFEVSQALTGLPDLLDFFDSLGTVARLCHKILHVHRGVIQVGLEVNFDWVEAEVGVAVLEQVNTCLICVRESQESVAKVLVLTLLDQCLDLIGLFL